MKKLARILPVMTAILLLGPVSTSAQEYTIHGKVTDADTGEPLIGCNVFLRPVSIRLEDATWTERNYEPWRFHDFGAATDCTGDFTLENVPAGQWTLVCSYIGYYSFKFKLRIPEDTGCDDREIYFCLSETPDRILCQSETPEVTLLFTCRTTISARPRLVRKDEMNQRTVITQDQIENLPIRHER